MALAGLERLDPKDFLTADIWNALMDILEAKFAGGIGTSDITWPLVAQGDIDFSAGYEIIGLRKFWNVVNAAEYTDFAAALSAAEGLGSAAVLIPPYTNLKTAATTINSSNITIFGFGPTSVLQITAASTGPLLQTATTGVSDIAIEDLMLDGTGGGAGCKGVIFKRVTRPRMRRVYMTAFTDDFVFLTNGGVAGQSCVDGVLDELHCSLGTAEHIAGDDIAGLEITKFVSKSAGADAISFVPGSSSHLIQDILISGGRIHGGAAKGVRIVGSGATGIDAHSRNRVENTHVTSMTSTPFELGTTSLLLKDTSVIGCSAPAAAGDALRIASNIGIVSGNMFADAGADGIDMSFSKDLFVHGNNCKSATAYGINATSSETCDVLGNNCSGAGTDGILRTSSTGLRALENLGDDAPTIGNGFFDNTSTTVGGTTTGVLGPDPILTIPANSLKTGDVIEVEATITTEGGASGTLEMRLNAVGFNGMAFVASQVYTYNVVIRAATGGANNSHTTVFHQSGAVSSIGTGGPVVDWTIDQELTFNITAHAGSGNVILNRVVVRMLGSK